MKKIVFLMVAGSLLATACSDKKRKPSIVYMPDMYYATAYDPYEKATFGYPDYAESSDVPVFQRNHNMSALEPVEGSVPHNDGGILPWTLPYNNAGYEQSKSVTSPLNPANKEVDHKRGELLYKQNCSVCHGANGDGQGSIVKSKAYSGVPTFAERNITVGSVYHVIMYGKNAMGSYASHLTPVDRWRVAEYVMSLKNAGNDQAAPAETPTANVEPADSTASK